MIVCTADTTGEGRKTCNCAVCVGYKTKLFVSVFSEKMLECSSVVKVTKLFLTITHYTLPEHKA